MATAAGRPLSMVVITIGWVSFLAAGVAEMLFFATFDPGALLQAATFPFPLSHSAVYTIGFVLFWLLGAATAAATTWLLAATPHRSPLADRFDDDAGDSR